MKRLLVLFAVPLLFSCVDISIDPDELSIDGPDGPTVEFDPAGGVIPLPNAILLDPDSGILNIPEGCNESAAATATRAGILNQMDGFGTFKSVMQVTFTTPPDLDTLPNRLKLFQRVSNGVPVDPLVAQEIPIIPVVGNATRYTPDCSELFAVDNVSFVPAVPLEENSLYTAVLLDGLRDESGINYISSVFWGLVSGSDNPVTVLGGSITSNRTPLNPAVPEERESLLAISALWDAFNSILNFVGATLDISKEEVLIAWDIKTQTITSPLDAAVPGSPASALPNTTPPVNPGGPGLVPLYADDGDIETFIEGALGSPGACASLGCAAVETIFAGAIVSTNFQSETPNPLGSSAAPVPGQWSDPLVPAEVGSNNITVTAFLPKGEEPAGGWPVVVFGHGITRTRNDLLAIGSQLAANGLASIAIDWVNHGNPDPSVGGRAVQIDDSSPQCQGSPDPSDRDTGGITCFAPLFSSNLGATRDNVRQSVLDGLALINALKLCSADTCGAGFNIDAGRIGYLGQSLGALFGAILVAMSPDIKSAVLNVGGASWVDIIENTDSLGLRCPLVDALIDAGILEGEKFNPAGPSGLCLGSDWKTQPAWLSFANTARWILDSADGVNFVARLFGRPVLIQEVVDDETVPNISTTTLATLLGLSPVSAATDDAINPTPEVAGSPGSAHFVQYASSGSRTYDHGALLAPANTDPDGLLATQQLQTDAITYLVLGLAP